MNNPDHISEKLETISWVNILVSGNWVNLILYFEITKKFFQLNASVKIPYAFVEHL
jgi:hypothetical protein